MTSSPQPSTHDASPPVLSYGVVNQASDSRMPGILLLLGTLPLTVVPFVSFYAGVSPIYVMLELTREVLERRLGRDIVFGLVAAPFFLGLIIPLLEFRRLVPARIRPWERAVATAPAGACVLMTIGLNVYGIIFEGLSNEMALFLIGPAILILGAITLWRIRQANRSADLCVTALLLISYLANAILCLCVFRDTDAIGWKLTLVGCAAPICWLIWTLLHLPTRL